MRVLLVSAGDEPLRDPDGAVARRLAGYAARVDALTQIAYSPLGHDCRPTRLGPCFASYPTRSASRPAFFPDALAVAARLLASERFDLIETQDPVFTGLVGLTLGRRFGVPVVVACHTEFFSNRAWLRERPRHLAEYAVARAAVRFAAGVRVVSDALARSVEAAGVPADRIGVAPVPVDRGLYARGRDLTPKRRRRRGTHPPRLLFVGRIVPSKGLPVLFEALRAVPRATLDVVGDGPERARLAKVAPKGVTFHGAVSPEGLSDFYWRADAVVLPTLYEGYGRVLVEGALHGAPGLATRVGGVSELVVDRQTGLLVPPNEPAALAGAIDELTPDRVRTMGHAAWQRAVALYDPERQADDIVAFWRRIAALGAR